MSQHAQYGYYDPYSSGGNAIQGGQQPPHPAQQNQQPYPSQGPAPPAAPGAPAQPPPPQQPAPHPPAQGPQGPARMDVSDAGGPAAAGAGPQAGPAGPPSTPAGPQPAPGGGGMPVEPAAQPLVDIMETPEEVVIIADVPGYDEEEITIQADETTITILAERGEDETDDEYRIVRAERPRRLERLIHLPVTGNIDEASATHENGVCTVTIPKDGTNRREIGFH